MANKKPNMQILPDQEALAQRCLELVLKTAKDAIDTNGIFCMAISGGQTPKRFFELLSADQQSLSFPWDKVHLFWVDERYVPPDSKYSNYKLAADTFLKKVPLPKENVHPIPTKNKDFNKSAREYEKTIRSVFKIKPGQKPQFDLIMLGMGSDGHTASLFPNSNACFDTNDIACVVYLLDQQLPDEMVNRITLTHPVLCDARLLAIIVSGEEKAPILKEVLETDPEDIRYPIHLLWPAIDRSIWLVDSPAAKLL